MRQNINSMGMLHRFIRNLQRFLRFLLNPWISGVAVKPLEKRVDMLERRVHKDLSDTEERLLSMMDNLQNQMDFLYLDTKNRLDKFIEGEIDQKVMVGMNGKNDFINEIKPETQARNKIENQEQYKQEIQTRQDRIERSILELQSLTASLPNLETKRAACLEAGRWLLAQREELAMKAGNELLNLQNSEIEEFRFYIGKYLKLLGHCLENAIEPRLLYEGVITHPQRPSSETYLQGFDLIRTKYISESESSNQISPEAAIELRESISYLFNYFVDIFV